MAGLDDDLAREFQERLAQLDADHKRARSPKARRRIERAIRAVHAEAAEMVRLGRNVDESFRRWVATLNPPKGTA